MATTTRISSTTRISRFHLPWLRLRWPSPAYLFLIPMAVFTSVPLLYIFMTAFKPLDELLTYPPPLLVRRPTLINFQELLIATNASAVPFVRYLFNSVFVTSVTVFLTVVISSLAAYPLAKMPVPGKNVIFALIVSALMFPKEVTAIPGYLVVHQLGMIDTYWAMILPPLGLGAFSVFLMKQFLEQVPFEMIEAGRIDGAGEFRIFWSLVMPLARPAWATLMILTFNSVWNDAGASLIYTRSDAMRTLPLAMQSLTSGTGIARMGVGAAAGLVMLLPVLIVFVWNQKRVMQTMAYSGIKS